MEVKAVSALRSKRGLHRVNGASPGEIFPDPFTAAQPVISRGEPPVVGLAFETTDERKTDTMKPYILRTAKPVERQKSIRPPRPKPAAPVAVKGPVLFIGLDVPNDSIAVSLAPSDSTEVRRYGILGGTHAAVDKLLQKLGGANLELRGV